MVWDGVGLLNKCDTKSEHGVINVTSKSQCFAQTDQIDSIASPWLCWTKKILFSKYMGCTKQYNIIQYISFDKYAKCK